MADVSRTWKPRRSSASERYRVTLRRGPHRWSFAFAPADIESVLARVTELARDPDAPLTEADARCLRRQILHFGRMPKASKQRRVEP